jgi:hypothetical protein
MVTYRGGTTEQGKNVTINNIREDGGPSLNIVKIRRGHTEIKIRGR